MKQIFSILKKHLPKIGFIIVFLVLLANCDLALPSYTSNIVNVGIQQNGIENAVPIVIRKTTFNSLKMILNENSEVLDNYTMISKNTLIDEEYEEYVELYPLLKTESLYILEDVSNEKISEIEDEMKYAIALNSFIMQAKTTSSNITNTENLPTKEVIEEKLDELGDTIVEQYAINSIKTEYEEIGVDIESLQMKYITKTGLKMLGITILSALITICNSFLISRLSAMFSKELRSKVVKKVMGFSNEEFESLSASSLITRTTNDIQQI